MIPPLPVNAQKALVIIKMCERWIEITDLLQGSPGPEGSLNISTSMVIIILKISVLL